MAALDDSFDAVETLAPRPAAEIPPGGLVLSGYLSDTSGIGRGGRMSLDALRAAGLSPLTHDLRRQPEGWGASPAGGVWFCHCNAPEALQFLMRSEDARACYRVGYWAWELPELPPDWINIAELFHEIWVPSEFVADSLRRGAPGISTVIRRAPHPLPRVEAVQPDRQRFGAPAEAFTFLCMYDVHSSATRKNPMGAISAFQQAFDPGRTDVMLLVKVVAAHQSQTCVAELEAQTAGWPNIRLLTEMLSDADADVLIASADAFVSLHRAEGFGLSIAQAMALGRPVIVTGWSGNMDFCDEGAVAVGYRLIPVEDPHGVYAIYAAPGQVWADPDLQAAAAAMRDFADHPDRARALGEAGRQHIRERVPTGYDIEHLRPWLA
jgi:glycosyltransferase involved in cell wall biosynthesis